MKFQCDKCGECCRNLDKSNIYADLDRGDGVCKYLEGNLCSVYEIRPKICRVDECYEDIFCQIMTREKYYQLNYESCQLLKGKKENK